MNGLKKLFLTLSSLLVVAFSFSFTKTSDVTSSFQSKSIEFQFTALAADDIDDDFGDPEFEKISEKLAHASVCAEPDQIEADALAFDPPHNSIPFYLQVRNLRI